MYVFIPISYTTTYLDTFIVLLIVNDDGIQCLSLDDRKMLVHTTLASKKRKSTSMSLLFFVMKITSVALQYYTTNAAMVNSNNDGARRTYLDNRR